MTTEISAGAGLFLDGTPDAESALRATVDAVVATVVETDKRPPFPSRTPAQLRTAVQAIDPFPADPVPLGAVVEEIGADVLAHGVRTTDPWCAAHLHPPTLLSAAVAELAIGLTNQSMDSFDQAPAATYVEDHLVRSLAARLGLPAEASGVLTSGGTASNLLGLLLARQHVAPDVNAAGLPPDASSWRILTSDTAHVSIRQAATVLGLGRRCVVAVETDHHGRMSVDALDGVLKEITAAGDRVIAIVGTAGTTDAGAIDPLPDLADRARGLGAWFHVDAAVGAGLALSDRLRTRLAGLEQADSITADLHKLWWQPIGASALLVRDHDTLHGFREPAEYLNRRDGTAELDLVDRSLDTSRRFDALKIVIALRATGRRRLADMTEHLVALAQRAGTAVRDHPGLELLADPQTITVLFRCSAPGATGDDDRLDQLNIDVQQTLLSSGQAVVGRTRWRGRVALKLTLINPLATTADVVSLLDHIATTAGEISE